MFRSSENLRLAADMRALERVAAPWREARTTWFDGTPDSIEARLAETNRILTVARSGYTPAHLGLTIEAENARKELLASKHRLLIDFLDDGARSSQGSKRTAGPDNYINRADLEEYLGQTMPYEDLEQADLPGLADRYLQHSPHVIGDHPDRYDRDEFDGPRYPGPNWKSQWLDANGPSEDEYSQMLQDHFTGRQGSRRVAGADYGFGGAHDEMVRNLLNKWQSSDPNDPDRYSKYHFYSDTAHVPISQLSALTGIDPGVIEMRRSDLKKMGPVTAGAHDVDPEARWKNTVHDDPYWDMIPHPDFAELDLRGDYKGRHRADPDNHWADDGWEREAARHRMAAIDFVASQNVTDRQELLFRAHRHASDRTGQLPVPTAQRVVQAFVKAVNREIPAARPEARTASAPTSIPDFSDELLY